MKNFQQKRWLQSCPEEEQIPFFDFSFFPVRETSALETLDKTLEDMHIMFPHEEDDVSCNANQGVVFLSNESNDSRTESSSFSTSSLSFTSSADPSSLSPHTAPYMFPPLSTPRELGGLVPLLSEKLGGPMKKPKDSKPKKHHERKWSVRYKELLEYIKENGHANVPQIYPENQGLACWVKRQRRLYKQLVKGEPTAMTDERLKLLTETGFIFDSHEIIWREKLDALEDYRKKEGHCNVPSNYKDKQLAIWVKWQRRQYKLFWEGKTTAMGLDRIRELEKKGFEWEVRTYFSKNKSNF